MSVLITYASKHGSTREIAERIAAMLETNHVDVDVQPMKAVKDVSNYDAFVVGSAVYFGSWMKDATAFVRQHQDTLSQRPVWLFSSGPLGTDTVDAEGNDPREAAEPKELAELIETLKPRKHLVFYGALDSHDFGFTERLLHALPAGKKLLLEGDFRDWDEINRWAEMIAQDLQEVVTIHD